MTSHPYCVVNSSSRYNPLSLKIIEIRRSDMSQKALIAYLCVCPYIAIGTCILAVHTNLRS